MNPKELERCEKFIANVGKEFKRIRETAHLSKQNIAERSGLSNSSITRVEEHEIEPTMLSFYRMSKALNLDFWRVIKSVEQSQKGVK